MAQATIIVDVVAGLIIGKSLVGSPYQTIVQRKAVPRSLKWELMFKKIVFMTKNGILFHFARIAMQKPELLWKSVATLL